MARLLALSTDPTTISSGLASPSHPGLRIGPQHHDLRVCGRCAHPVDVTVEPRPTGFDHMPVGHVCAFCGHTEASQCAAEAPLSVLRQNYWNWRSAAVMQSHPTRCWCCLRSFPVELLQTVEGRLGMRLQCRHCGDGSICQLHWLRDNRIVHLVTRNDEHGNPQAVCVWCHP